MSKITPSNSSPIAAQDGVKCAECDGYGTLGSQLLPCFECKGSGRTAHAAPQAQGTTYTAGIDLLNAEELAALRRFDECAQDGEGYDVPKEMMQRLAEIGVVQRRSGAYYQATDFGQRVLGAAAAPPDAHDEMLDMLGRIHPMAMPVEAMHAQRDERIERAFVMQQPPPVPDQACIVWRWDVMSMRNELVRLRAYRDNQPAATVAPAAPAWDAEDAQTQAARDVLAERRRQVEAEGWTPGHDDGYVEHELIRAAACYALSDAIWVNDRPVWPWSMDWWKPCGGRPDLIKAGALILAEIERLDRIGRRGEGHE